MTQKPSPSLPKRPWLDANDLKARTLIRDVLEGYDLLDAMTDRGDALVGPSPFHGGETLSFRVDPERGIWNDFQGRPEACKGNVIGLVQALEDCTFAEALHIVAERFAAAPREESAAPPPRDERRAPPRSARPRENQSRQERHRPPGGRSSMPPASRSTETPTRSGAEVPEEAHEGATQAEHGEQALGSADLEHGEAPLFGKELRGLRYDVPLLAERSITSKTAQAYGVGYCTRGLMKSRVVAPVRCIDGQIAGYVGRSLKAGPGEVLWKNPAGFPRSHYLFGLHRALESGRGRKAIKDYGLVVVQSPLDVLRLAQAGFPNAVALMAVTASRHQLALLTDPQLNPTRRVTLAFNDDEPGHAGKREAASQLIHSAFVRYACWKALDAAHASPDRLGETELQALLGLRTQTQ